MARTWHEGPRFSAMTGLLFSTSPTNTGAIKIGAAFVFDLQGNHLDTIFKNHFGTGDRFRHGDIDRDLDLDLDDFSILKENFGNAATTAPELAGWILFGLGAIIWTLAAQRLSCRSQFR